MNNQQEQEERQKKILEAIRELQITILIAWNGKTDVKSNEEKKMDLEYLDFLASECGIEDLWRKRNGD